MNQALFFSLPAICSLLLGKLVISWYTKHHWLDDPQKTPHPKVVHSTPVPRGGGLVVGIALIISLAILFPLGTAISAIIVGVGLLTLLGFWDDIADPHPVIRLGIQMIVASIPIVFGIGIRYVTNPFGGILSFQELPVLAAVLTLIWIVWCMNIVNFSTGLDGQMPGYIAIAAVTIALLSLRYFPDPEQIQVHYLALVGAGAYVGFLFWNRYPQRMMSGFGASTIAGFYIAVLSILSSAKLATAMMVLAVPMVDALYVISRRLLHKKSPFWGDRSHLHHALLDAGFSKRAVAYIYWSSALGLGLLSLQLNSGQKVFAILLIVAVVCMIGTWLRLGLSFFVKSDQDNG